MTTGKFTKNTYKRVFIALFALLLLLPLGVSCAGERSGVGDGTSAPDESTAAPEAGIACADLAGYKFIRPEKAGSELVSVFRELYSRFNDAVGAETEQSDDFYREGVPGLEIAELEIIIGDTNRPESRQFLKGLRADDYGYALIGKKLVIAGHTDEYTIKAVNEFTGNILSRFENDKSREMFITASENYTYNAKYTVDAVTLGGVDIREWRIVYPSKRTMGENKAAEKLRDKISALCGYVLDVVKDSDAEAAQYEISVGETSHSDATLVAGLQKAGSSSYIGCAGTSVLLGGGNSTALLDAVSRFGDEITAAINRDGRTVAVTLEAEKLYDSSGNLLTAMSFNNLVSSKTDARTERVIEMVMKYLPDTVGFQETNSAWLNSLVSGLGSFYAYVGEGRDGGSNGEYNPIFYNKTKFKVVKSGTRWLSDTPEKASKYEESSLNRIYTYALLERISDGEQIMVINTHLEHTSDAARVKQIKVVLAFIQEYCKDYPIVLTGDFNCTSSSSVYSTITKTSLSDSADVAMQAKRASTFTNYGKSDKVIDFIFVTADKIGVSSYKVCNEKINGDYPSDHHPVLIEYCIVD